MLLLHCEKQKKNKKNCTKTHDTISNMHPGSLALILLTLRRILDEPRLALWATWALALPKRSSCGLVD